MEYFISKSKNYNIGDNNDARFHNWEEKILNSLLNTFTLFLMDGKHFKYEYTNSYQH